MQPGDETKLPAADIGAACRVNDFVEPCPRADWLRALLRSRRHPKRAASHFALASRVSQKRLARRGRRWATEGIGSGDQTAGVVIGWPAGSRTRFQ
jgi:hypothetical protein